MKAWKVSNKVKENIEPEIIYADSSKEALLFSTLYYDDNDFAELVAEHAEYADDKEDLSEGDFLVMLLENGWEYPEYGIYILDTESIKGDDIHFINGPKIDDIPYYNATNKEMQTIEFLWYPTEEEYKTYLKDGGTFGPATIPTKVFGVKRRKQVD